jgi:FtsP/CotA-like multicopper oxidase with cupredoxin domain
VNNAFPGKSAKFPNLYPSHPFKPLPQSTETLIKETTGPLLEANWGDTFQITVSNQITSPEEGTLLHWHGLLHKGAPWNDGVPAVDLCPIAPGKSFTYTFKADLYGTSWWHSHYSAQLANGLMGPMVIYGFVILPQIAYRVRVSNSAL